MRNSLPSIFGKPRLSSLKEDKRVTPFMLLLSETPSPRLWQKDLVKAAENADTGIRTERLNASHSPFLDMPVKVASDF